MDANVPPPINPASQRAAATGTPPPVASPQTLKRISGTQGMTPAEIHEAVSRGARFVLFQFCISVVVMSFKRSSPICFIKPGESSLGKGAPYSLISIFAGWWGIPWGPIWTLTTLANNLGGGKDVTRQVLSAYGLSMPATTTQFAGSPAEAEEREARKSSMLRIAWGIVALVVLALAWFAYKMYQASQHGSAGP
jgi:hypothetical protein